MQSTWNLERVIILIKEMFPENFIEIRLREGIFWKFASKRDHQNMRNFQKMPSRSWISMKFSGNLSFINIMTLSKFQVGSITQTNFGNFLYIGTFVIFAPFQFTKNGCKPPKMDFFEKFLRILFLYIKWHQKITTHLEFEDRPI